ncbi:TPA: hypothetical protein SMP57_002414 [Proteus mirabilis]|nr:hypothetical protein [Proteus mirabilis]HEK2692508.1 hypothetical protein [Proteus mirabilis]
MKTKAKILDRRTDNDSSECYLSKMSLEDYINALNTTYQDYDIQRGIVSNVYLDHLVDTVLNQCHIPPIVLVIDDTDFNIIDDNIEIHSFKILDGLQRTYRLQAINKTIEFCCNNLDSNTDYLSWPKFQLSKQYSNQLNEFNSNTNILRSVIEVFQKKGKEHLLQIFKNNHQWFEIWTHLTPHEQVLKMLMLNAGHKPVSTRHQLELLFLNILPALTIGDGKEFTLVREKEISSPLFSNKREIGSFHFAHVITALLSLTKRKPVAPSTNLIQSLQSIDLDSNFDSYSKIIDPDVLQEAILFLLNLDKMLSKQYGKVGCLWMGREASLSGLFGAIGKFANESDMSPQKVMNMILTICEKNPSILNLDDFERARNSIDLSKVNIGDINRSAVFSAITDMLKNKPSSISDWKEYFRIVVEEK